MILREGLFVQFSSAISACPSKVRNASKPLFESVTSLCAKFARVAARIVKVHEGAEFLIIVLPPKVKKFALTGVVLTAPFGFAGKMADSIILSPFECSFFFPLRVFLAPLLCALALVFSVISIALFVVRAPLVDVFKSCPAGVFSALFAVSFAPSSAGVQLFLSAGHRYSMVAQEA